MSTASGTFTLDGGNNFVAVFDIAGKQKLFSGTFSPPMPGFASAVVTLTYSGPNALEGPHSYSGQIESDKVEFDFRRWRP